MKKAELEKQVKDLEKTNKKLAVKVLTLAGMNVELATQLNAAENLADEHLEHRTRLANDVAVLKSASKQIVEGLEAANRRTEVELAQLSECWTAAVTSYSEARDAYDLLDAAYDDLHAEYMGLRKELEVSQKLEERAWKQLVHVDHDLIDITEEVDIARSLTEAREDETIGMAIARFTQGFYARGAEDARTHMSLRQGPMMRSPNYWELGGMTAIAVIVCLLLSLASR